ncbi:MAG: Holliday junction resolvase RuvX [Bdellovibrionales bacterium]|nr:Holliday junction resolvase RuvX [Bdellovibrionales bacterium]
MRVLGIDVGSKRVGVAFDAGTQGIAIQPYGVFFRAQNAALREIVSLVTTLQVDLVVVGVPLGSDGESASSQAQDCLRFGEKLRKRISVELCFVDESFSSLEAESRLREANRARPHADAEAATIVVERYFESIRKDS